eukprot:3629900-Pyramimonas_sp.AAC.1
MRQWERPAHNRMKTGHRPRDVEGEDRCAHHKTLGPASRLVATVLAATAKDLHVLKWPNCFAVA